MTYFSRLTWKLASSCFPQQEACGMFDNFGIRNNIFCKHVCVIQTHFVQLDNLELL